MKRESIVFTSNVSLLHNSFAIFEHISCGCKYELCYLYMQLKKEVKELTLQRDLAQSQIKDMLLQGVGDDESSIEVVSILALP